MKSYSGLVAFLLFCSPIFAVSQSTSETSPTPSLRTDTTQVSIDAVVTDKKGNYVRNLSDQNFRIFEDGKERQLKRMSTNEGSPDARKVSFVLLFDLMQFDDQVFARNAAMQIIGTTVGADSPLALVEYQGNGTLKLAHGFSANASELQEAVKNSRSSGVAGSEVHAARLSGDTLYHPDATPRSNGIWGDANGDFNVRSRLWSLETLAKNLAAIPGPKTLVWFTPGLYVNQNEQDILTTLIETCNKSDITVYPIQVRINTELQQPLRSLATATGGFAITGNNDILSGLRSITEDQEHRYALAYLPNVPSDGRCHNINVKVDRDGVLVRSRKQHCDFRYSDPLAGTGAERELQARLAEPDPGVMRVHVTAPFFYTAANRARVHVAAEFSPAVIKFTKQNGKLHAKVNVLGIASKDDGTIAARFTDSLDFDFNTKEEVELFKQSSYRYQNQFEAPAGRYTLRLVFSPESGVFGLTETRVNVSPYDDKLMSMSGVALSKEFSGAGTSSGTALFSSRTALISKNVQFTPMGNALFKKSDPATVYFEVYEPRLVAAGDPPLQIQLKIVDLENATVKVDSGSISTESWKVPGTGVVPVALKLAIASLPSGYYRVDVRALDSKGLATPWRSAEFALE